jgi:hypothetical protein
MMMFCFVLFVDESIPAMVLVRAMHHGLYTQQLGLATSATSPSNPSIIVADSISSTS